MIAAVDQHLGIGKENGIPWHLPADFAYFKHTTLGHPIVMGRKTFESIGKPLPGRANIVITRDPSWSHPGTTSFQSLEDAISFAQELDRTIFIIGGSQIYCRALTLCQRIYLTRVQGSFDCDTFFPSLDDSWDLTSQQKRSLDDNNPYDMLFEIYDKKPL